MQDDIYKPKPASKISPRLYIQDPKKIKITKEESSKNRLQA